MCNFWQILHLSNKTVCGQINLTIWTNTFQIWKNTFDNLDQYILQLRQIHFSVWFGQIHFTIWTNTTYLANTAPVRETVSGQTFLPSCIPATSLQTDPVMSLVSHSVFQDLNVKRNCSFLLPKVQGAMRQIFRPCHL